MNLTRAIRPDHVAVYIRWSTDDQSEGTTLAVQREACGNYVLSQGWTCRQELVFIDDGYSGGSLRRPALGRLRSLIGEGEVDCVVVFKLDRLSRSVVDTVNLVLREWNERAYVKSAREPIDTTTAMGKQFFYMLAGYAEWERSVIRERTQAGRLKRVQEGKNPGFRPPFGYRTGSTRGSFVVVEPEAAVVRRVFELYIAGQGYQRIAAALTADGIHSRAGHAFSGRAIAEILGNRMYIGELVYRKRPVNPLSHLQEGVPRQVRNPAPLVVKSPLIPAILAPECFAQAEALRQQRAAARTPSRALGSEHLLTGIARCRQCGYTLIGRKPERAGAAEYYVCGGQKLKGRSLCRAAYIRQDELDALIVARLQQRFGDAVRRQGSAAAAAAARGRELAQVQAGLCRLRAEAAALERELAVIARDYRRERLTLAEYHRHEAQVLRDREAVRQRIAGAEARGQELEQAAGTGPVSGESVPLWAGLTQAEKKHLLRECIADLRVAREAQCVHCDITWVGPATPPPAIESLPRPG